MQAPAKKEKFWRKVVHTPTKKVIENEAVHEEYHLKMENLLAWLGKKCVAYLNI